MGSLASPYGPACPRRPQPRAPGSTRTAKRCRARAVRSSAIHPYSTTSAGASRASSHAAATAPHTRREQANMRATLIVVRELLRCRLMESGRDALLERVAELLDAAASGAPPFCYRLSPQATAGPRGEPHHIRVPSTTPGGFINISTADGVGGSNSPMPPSTSTSASVAPMVPARCRIVVPRTPSWAEQHGAWGTMARCSG